MAVDPKYAALPGIATDQPDVYETSDLPESDQPQTEEPEELGSESVERLALDPKEAYKRFKGKGIDAGRADFSDRVKVHRHTGYDATEYELLGEGEQETPLQKYQRLQAEVKDLADELSKLKATIKDENAVDKMSPVELARQVEYLQNQLTDLHVEKITGQEAHLDLADPLGALQRRLLESLETFKHSKQDAKSPTKGKPAGDKVTYELYYRAEQAKFSESARLAALEQRLERMEAVIGQQPEKLSVLTAGLANKSLMGAVTDLTAKSNVMDPDQLSAIDARLHGLLSKLNQVSEKKAAISDEKLAKISELYDIVKRWDEIALALPHLVDRVAGLKELHQQALQFSAAITHLDTSQQQVAANLTAHSDMVKQLQSNFEKNMKVIKSNIESMDQRLKALKK
ncbi:dynactin subunit 2 [Lingula anatina]|uniref:Dynactin subunit 2 n=1 Tax=Lingula anatina TaxID=7574 RepID=A0A1S3GZ53_LINAN|nr:dynactin subunit 2 [Lingula anatina]|eukprot:XP_013379155.1 dynactin subunit 2 [Lingula anatina]